MSVAEPANEQVPADIRVDRIPEQHRERIPVRLGHPSLNKEPEPLAAGIPDGSAESLVAVELEAAAAAAEPVVVRACEALAVRGHPWVPAESQHYLALPHRRGRPLILCASNLEVACSVVALPVVVVEQC